MGAAVRRLRRSLDSRILWVPGDPPEITFDFREAGSQDVSEVRKRLPQTLQDEIFVRAYSAASGVVRLATRSQRALAGFAVSLHSPDANEIHATWVHDRYRGTTCLTDLIIFAMLEVPEAPTILWVPEEDVATQQSLAAWGGWRAEQRGYSIRFDRGPAFESLPEAGLPQTRPVDTGRAR